MKSLEQKARFRERKTARYKEEILNWDWSEIEASFEPFAPEFYFDDDEKIEAVYVGSVFSLTPSRKIYTVWTSNQTARDVILDECWCDAFESVLSAKGYFYSRIDERIFVCRHAEIIDND